MLWRKRLYVFVRNKESYPEKWHLQQFKEYTLLELATFFLEVEKIREFKQRVEQRVDEEKNVGCI